MDPCLQMARGGAVSLTFLELALVVSHEACLLPLLPHFMFFFKKQLNRTLVL